MLSQRDATANLAVKSLAVAKTFYGGVLELEQVDGQTDQVMVFRSGKTLINVYKSQYAGTNMATALTWHVDDVEGTVRALKAKGVQFEHYAMPGLSWEGDVSSHGDMKVAWFKDPDGNILNVTNQ